MKILKWMLIITIIIFAFVSGTVTTFWYLWPDGGAVKVKVINEADINISTITIKHENGSVTMNELATGKSKVIPVHVRGENYYTIIVHFENGVQLSGDGGYIEPGYTVLETITTEKITHDFKSMF